MALLTRYGIPYMISIARDGYAGKGVLVTGGGQQRLACRLRSWNSGARPLNKILWALRHSSVVSFLGCGLNDRLPESGMLGLAPKVMEDGQSDMLTSFVVDRIETQSGELLVEGSLAGKRSHFELIGSW